MAFWDQSTRRYFLTSVEYLLETKKSFTSITGGYPDNEKELNTYWERHLTSRLYEQIYDVTVVTNLPSKVDRLKFSLGLHILNSINRVVRT